MWAGFRSASAWAAEWLLGALSRLLWVFFPPSPPWPTFLGADRLVSCTFPRRTPPHEALSPSRCHCASNEGLHVRQIEQHLGGCTFHSSCGLGGFGREEKGETIFVKKTQFVHEQSSRAIAPAHRTEAALANVCPRFHRGKQAAG